MSFRVDDLYVGYGRRLVLTGLGFAAAEDGAVSVLIGPNASGKTTFFRCVAGLLRHRRGRIMLDDIDLGPVAPRQRVRQVCYVPQQVPMRAALTVFEVVLLARQQGGRRWTTDPADVAAVEEALDSLGIDDLGQRPVHELSGGQQQLVIVAQALVREPRLLLLDEPTSALDLRRQLEVMELIQTVTRRHGTVTIIAVHDLNLAARYGDRLLLLKDGRIAADGPPRHVLVSDYVKAAYGVDVDLVQAREDRLLVDARLASEAGRVAIRFGSTNNEDGLLANSCRSRANAARSSASRRFDDSNREKPSNRSPAW